MQDVILINKFRKGLKGSRLMLTNYEINCKSNQVLKNRGILLKGTTRKITTIPDKILETISSFNVKQHIT